MRNWDELTELGQYRRLRALAAAALESYDITVKEISLVGGFTNVIYRIDAIEARFALRVDLFQDHTDQDVDIELDWLAALRRDTDLHVVHPVLAADGSAYVYATADGVPGARRCTLFEWVPGKPIAKNIEATTYTSLGEITGQLHEHAATYTPPFQPMAWDQVFYWPATVDPYALDDPLHAHHFEGRRHVLDETIRRVKAAFGRLDVSELRVVHGDIHLWNVHQRHTQLLLLDFEDVMWAHPVQDIGITFYYNQDHPRYPEFRAAYEAGYRSVRSWPETYPGQVEDFVMARTLMFANFVLNMGIDPTDFYATAFPRMQAYLER
jgi:Ser/Thr protein kinase RdoA (MazF antagonist)